MIKHITLILMSSINHSYSEVLLCTFFVFYHEFVSIILATKHDINLRSLRKCCKI